MCFSQLSDINLQLQKFPERTKYLYHVSDQTEARSLTFMSFLANKIPPRNTSGAEYYYMILNLYLPRKHAIFGLIFLLPKKRYFLPEYCRYFQPLGPVQMTNYEALVDDEAHPQANRRSPRVVSLDVFRGLCVFVSSLFISDHSFQVCILIRVFVSITFFFGEKLNACFVLSLKETTLSN